MNKQTYAASGTILAALAILTAFMMVLAPTGQAISFKLNKRVDIGNKDSENPVIAVNSTGTIVLVWADNRNGNWDIMSAKKTPSMVNWDGDYTVNDITTNNQTAPDMAIAPKDRVHVVWQDNRSSTDHIYYSNSINGGTIFSTSQRVDDSMSGAQRNPAIAVNATTELVVWEDTRDGNYNIYFSKSTDNGTSWSTNKRVDDDSGSFDQRYPDIEVDRSGKIVVVWQDHRRGNWDIFSSVSTDGGSTWSANIRVDSTGLGTSDQEHPRIVVDLEKKFHVVWQDTRLSYYTIRYSNSTNPADSWSSDVRVDNSFSGSGMYPSVAADINKMVHVVWQDYRDSGNPDIWYANITKAGGFVEHGAPTKIDNSSSGTQSYPRITVDGNANIFIAWQSNQNGNYDIFYTRNNNIQPNPPTPTKPTNGGWIKTPTPTFNWTFTDPDVGDTQTAFQLQVYNSTGTVYDSNVTLSAIGSHTITSSLPDGVYNWHVKTRDTNGAWSYYSTPWTVKVDTVGPMAGTPTDAGKWSSSQIVTWNWPPATDNGSGVAMYYICVDTTPGGCSISGDSTSTQFTTDLGGASDGKTYYAKVKAKDVAGNNGTYGSNSDGITVDLTAPTASVPTDEGKYTKSQALKWDWTASSDLVSGVAGYYVCIGSNPGGCDVVNNLWTNAINYTYQGGQNGVTYYAKIKAKDNATNVGSYGGNSDGITVDLVAPSAARPVTSSIFTPTVDIKFWWAPCVDDISGIKGYFVYIGTLPDGSDVVNGVFVTKTDYTYHGAQNGKTYYAFIKAEDNATNIGLPSMSSSGVTVDLTLPSVPTVYDEGLTNWDVQAKCWWEASEDQESGVVKYQVQLVQGTTVIKQANTTLTSYKFVNATAFLQHGKMYVFKVRALNGAGNWSLWGSSPGLWVDLQVNDTKAPMHNGLYSNSTSIQWTWAAVVDGPGGIDGYQIDIGTVSGGHDVVSQGWTTSNSYLFTGGVNGQTYYITVAAKDKAGNIADPVMNKTGITIDLSPPDTGPVYDAGAYNPTTNITFTWDPLKDSVSGVNTYYIAIGTKPYLDDVLTTMTNKTSYIFRGAQVGKTYYAKVRAVDNAGNMGAWGESSDGIQVDMTPPSDVTLLVPNQFANTVNTLYLEWTASQDNISGVPYYMFSLGTTTGATDCLGWTRTNGPSVTIQGLTLVDGRTYYISIKPVNGAGLEGKILKAQVTIDTVAPTGPTSFVYPAFIGNTSITWKWAGALDDRSGIAGYLFSLGTGPGLKDLVSEAFVSGESYTYGSGINNRSYYATIVPVDKAGNKGTPIIAKPVKVDLLPPQIVRVTRAAEYSHSKNVTWTWQAVDSISGIDHYMVVVSEGDPANGTPLSIIGTRYSYTNVIEGHRYFIQVLPIDRAGNQGGYGYGDGITVDTVAPTAVVSVNNNATFVPSRQVTLQVTTTFKDVTFMIVSNVPTLSNANWEPYAASREWYLTQGDGPKDVYVVVRDASGLQSQTYKVTVTLKTTIPKLDVELPSDAVSTSDLTISGKTDPKASVFVNDKQVKVEDDGSFSTTIQLKDGTNQIDVLARDQAGNEVRVSRAVNKEPFVIPSYMLLLLVLILLVIAVVAMVYAYSANRRLTAMKVTPAKVVEEVRPPVKVVEPSRPKAPVREEEPPEEEPVEEEPVEAVEEEPEADELTLEEDGTVTRPDILARIRATEDSDAQGIKAAEAEGSDEITLETSEEEGGVEEPEPVEPEPVQRPLAQVRCNKCSNLIPLYKTERPLRIECPKCGKVGMIRK